MMADSDAEIAKLREQLRQLEAELEARQRPLLETSGGAVITGDVRAGRDVIGRDQILATLADRSVIIGGDADGLNVITGDGNTIHLSPDQIPPDTLLEAYYRSLAKECCHLPLGVIDTQFLRTGHEQAIPYVRRAGLFCSTVWTKSLRPSDADRFCWRLFRDGRICCRPGAPASW
jgi:hypothetical protein